MCIFYLQLNDFFTASEQINTLNNLSNQVSDELKYGRDLLRRALETQKNQCSWYPNWWDQPIDQVIANVEQLSEESVNEALKTIGFRVNDAKVAVARDILRNSTTVLAITSVWNTVQVISTYLELKDASNLVETSRKKLAPGGIITTYVEDAKEHVTKAEQFLRQGRLDEADSRLIRAAESSQLAHTELNGIQIQVKGQIKTLKTGRFLSVGSGISTCLMSILQVGSILATPTTGISPALIVSAKVFAGAGFLISAASTRAYFIANDRISELQRILEDIEKKMVEWRVLRSDINKLRDSVESKRLNMLK